jgi:hypothetical protein
MIKGNSVTKDEEIIRLKIQLGMCQAAYEQEHERLQAAERLLMARESVANKLEFMIKEDVRLMGEIVSYRKMAKGLKRYAARLEELHGQGKWRPDAMDDPDL